MSEGSRPTPPRTFQQQRCYLAGPMRGYAEYNFPAFHAAAAKLRGHGLEVWSPAEHDVNEDGFDPAKDTAQPMRHYMKRDLPAVLDCDLVAVLPGWEKSQGACLEVHVAQTCGIPVYHADTMQPVEMVSEIRDSEPKWPTKEEVAAYRDLFRIELDKNMNNHSGSPSTDAHQVALCAFVKARHAQR